MKKDSPRKQDLDTPLDSLICDVDSELCQTRNSSSPHDRVFEDDSVVDVSNVFRGLESLGSFDSEEVEDPDREFRELAIFDELAELSES